MSFQPRSSVRKRWLYGYVAHKTVGVVVHKLKSIKNYPQSFGGDSNSPRLKKTAADVLSLRRTIGRMSVCERERVGAVARKGWPV